MKRNVSFLIVLTILQAISGAPRLIAACAPLTDSLIAWWPGEGSGGALIGSPATLNGATTAPGYVGQAFEFDGSSHYLSTTVDGQPSALPYTTWEAWVYPTRLNHSSRQQIFSIDSGGYGRSVLIESGSSEFGVFTGSGVWRPTTATANEWQHIAVVFTPTNVLFYRNGVEFSYGQAPALRDSSLKLTIGRNPGYGEFFQGMIDEPAIHQRILDSSEINQLYLAGSAGRCTTTGVADVAVTIQSVPPVAQLAGYVTNVIVVVNLGPDTAVSPIVNYQLPAGCTLVDSQVSQGSISTSGDQVNGSLGSLIVGNPAEIRLTLRLTATGMQVHTAVVQNLDTDPNPANNSSMSQLQVYDRYTPTDGDWSAVTLELRDTPEAALMARTGNINNLGFGWPTGFDPFSGSSTPGHGFPWMTPTNSPPGTDRIMVVSSYVGQPPSGSDGYTGTTSRPGNVVEPVEINFNLAGLQVTSAALQLFVDDFQAPVWGADYTVTLNGVRAAFLENIINTLSQTGPIGKLISATFPPEFLPLLATNKLTILIDDTTTGAGDGFALDFAKLLINLNAFGQVGVIRGSVLDDANQAPVSGARISAGGLWTTTDSAGNYLLQGIPAGLAVVEASHPDYAPKNQPTDLLAGQTNTVSFNLTVQPRLRIDLLTPASALISWPSSLGNYILQTTLNVNEPLQWIPEGSVPGLLDGRRRVTNTIALPARLYRLAKP